MTYTAPTRDIALALESAGGLSDLIDRGLFEGVDRDLVSAVLQEAGKFASEQLAPLNRSGDSEGACLVAGAVRHPPGWKEAYRRWAEAGWPALPCPPDYGGQGLPNLISMAVVEIWNSANASFGLGPVLTQGAVHALYAVASDELKNRYLEKMVSGEWAGTMNLTESQAGSDLGGLRTRAEPQGDGTYRIKGTKIFISYGDHDFTDNIIHLVLARLPNAPPGTRGISLFLVPKFLVNDDGSLGERNDVVCSGVEEKLGIHASPTCVMTYGEKGGAVGYLVGEENRGLNAMFIMMNAARLAVGIQGVAVGEGATQHAIHYATERRQGRAETTPAGEMAPIIAHPDVQRNLLTMKALTSAARALCYATAREIDLSERATDAVEKAAAAGRAALLTPIAKAYGTDIGVEVASIGLQVHGGMGYVEETGAAQFYRDARIFPIYEGTNGIQAIDLVTRKLPLEKGAVMQALLSDLRAIAQDIRGSNREDISSIYARLDDALNAMEAAGNWLLQRLASGEMKLALAGATPYLRLCGTAIGGAYLARSAMGSAQTHNFELEAAKAHFFAGNQLALAPGLAESVMTGGTFAVTQHLQELLLEG